MCLLSLLLYGDGLALWSDSLPFLAWSVLALVPVKPKGEKASKSLR